MQLFYAPDIAPPLHTLTEDESAHCVRVLRLGPGDAVNLTDGRGTMYRCVIEDDHPKRCVVRVVETEHRWERLPYSLTMAVAPTKSADRYEWFLEKATEIGVSAVIPLETSHSERRVFKPERGAKVLAAAMKQSLKAYLPDLQPLTPLREVLTRPFSGRRFIAHCGEATNTGGKAYLPSTLCRGEDALILIGPEGDFSPEEVALALANGFEQISLGRERLRTETAAVAAVVMVSVINNISK